MRWRASGFRQARRRRAPVAVEVEWSSFRRRRCLTLTDLTLLWVLKILERPGIWFDSNVIAIMMYACWFFFSISFCICGIYFSLFGDLFKYCTSVWVTELDLHCGFTLSCLIGLMNWKCTDEYNGVSSWQCYKND